MMKKQFENILTKTGKKNGLSVLGCIVSLTLALGTVTGCSNAEPNSTGALPAANESGSDLSFVTPETQPTDIQEPDSRESEEETLSADGQEIKEIVEAFATAYFSGDKESIRNYLTTPYEWGIEVYEGAAGTVSNMSFKGLTEIGENDNGDICVVSLEYKSSEKSDSFLYLTIELIKQSDEWKIQFYGTER